LHHFFAMGASADVNCFFGVMTMMIAVRTGVKVCNWLFTRYGERVQNARRQNRRWPYWGARAYVEDRHRRGAYRNWVY
jgi:heme/copper-type cytochrome/quinol oxidase subunit 1